MSGRGQRVCVLAPIGRDAYGAEGAVSAGIRRIEALTGEAARRWLSERWSYQLGRALVELACRPRAVLAALVSNKDGNYAVIEVESLCGRILGLLRLRGQYAVARRSLREASWRRSEKF